MYVTAYRYTVATRHMSYVVIRIRNLSAPACKISSMNYCTVRGIGDLCEV